MYGNPPENYLCRELPFDGFVGRLKKGNEYKNVYASECPYSNKIGMVAEHRWVWWICGGELLVKGDVIHHINGDESDNRFENLRKMTVREHIDIHKRMRKNYNALQGILSIIYQNGKQQE